MSFFLDLCKHLLLQSQQINILYVSASSVQAGWAYNNDVNLLAAGYCDTSRGLGGSGVYAGRDGTLIATLSQHLTTKLLIAKVNSDQRGGKHQPTETFTFKEVKNSKLEFFEANFENFTTVEITGENSKLVYENDGFTCNVNVTSSSFGEGSNYRLVAFSGLRTYAHVRTVYIEVCGVVACASKSLSSCSQRISLDSPASSLTNITILASSNKHLLSFPITLDRNLLALQQNFFQFKTKKQNNKIEMNMVSKDSLKNIVTFSIFRNDGGNE